MFEYASEGHNILAKDEEEGLDDGVQVATSGALQDGVLGRETRGGRGRFDDDGDGCGGDAFEGRMEERSLETAAMAMVMVAWRGPQSNGLIESNFVPLCLDESATGP